MPIISGGGGGAAYVPPTARAQYGGGAAVTIGDGLSAPLNWGTLQIGTALLDVTTQTAPTIVTAGVYAFSVVVSAQAALTAGGAFVMLLECDAANDDPQVSAAIPQTATAHPAQGVATLVYYCPAGSAVKITVTNFDGAAARDFGCGPVVQRLS